MSPHLVPNEGQKSDLSCLREFISRSVFLTRYAYAVRFIDQAAHSRTDQQKTVVCLSDSIEAGLIGVLIKWFGKIVEF